MRETHTQTLTTIMHNLLNYQQKLDIQTKSRIHDVLCDMQIDEALKAIAECALQISTIYTKTSPAVQILKTQCEKIRAHAHKRDLKNALHTEYLEQIMHDLETIASLLDLNHGFLKAKDETAAQLCEILAIQATAQAVITAEFLRVMSMEPLRMKAKLFNSRRNNIVPFRTQSGSELFSGA